MGRGWQSVAAPQSSRPWIRTERTPAGWILVVSMESPRAGPTMLASYGPVPRLGRALCLLADLRHALAVAPEGNVPMVLMVFGLPSLPGTVATHVAAAAMLRAGTAASPEARTCGASSSPWSPDVRGDETATCSSSTKAACTSCRDER